MKMIFDILKIAFLILVFVFEAKADELCGGDIDKPGVVGNCIAPNLVPDADGFVSDTDLISYVHKRNRALSDFVPDRYPGLDPKPEVCDRCLAGKFRCDKTDTCECWEENKPCLLRYDAEEWIECNFPKGCSGPKYNRVVVADGSIDTVVVNTCESWLIYCHVKNRSGSSFILPETTSSTTSTETTTVLPWWIQTH